MTEIKSVHPIYASRRRKRATLYILLAVAILLLGWHVWAWIWGVVVVFFLNVLAVGWV
jgi:fatty acid desaturase